MTAHSAPTPPPGSPGPSTSAASRALSDLHTGSSFPGPTPSGAPGLVRLTLTACAVFGLGRLHAQPPLPQAPPPAPPIQYATAPFAPRAQNNPPPGASLWSIGQPTDEEQLYLEFINRARLDPAGEAVRLATTTDPRVLSAYSWFQVDLAQMQSAIAALPPVPPLAMSAALLQAAREHSLDMALNEFQDHIGTDGSSPGDRITRAGYSWSMYGENVYAYADSVFHGHAAFEVDWGNGPGGMQDPPGHRLNIHQAGFREAGIGVVNTNRPGVGPQIVTQDFATRSAASPFITGVVHFDLNNNAFYDPGEGIGGVEVIVTGNAWYGLTSISGGYAVPVPGDGSYTVTFVAPGLYHVTNVTVANRANVKLDLRPAYTPPYPVGPDPAALTNNNLYTCSAVVAATNYQWQTSQLLNDPFFEGGESDQPQITLAVSEGYDTRISGVAASGTYAFHLAHPTAAPQILQLQPTFWIRSNAQVRFATRLGWATSNQVARLQISTDDGGSWTDLWTRAGTGTSGQSSYTTQTVPLGVYAGKSALLRFVYDFTGGNYYYQTSPDVGWLLDDIRVEGAARIVSTNLIDSGPTAQFAFHPLVPGSVLMRVRAQLPGRYLPWGPAREIQVQAVTPPTVRFTGPVTWNGSELVARFEVTAPPTGMVLRLWRAAQPTGPWAEDTSARFESISGNTVWRVTTPAPAAQGFYRISVN